VLPFTIPSLIYIPKDDAHFKNWRFLRAQRFDRSAESLPSLLVQQPPNDVINKTFLAVLKHDVFATDQHLK